MILEQQDLAHGTPRLQAGRRICSVAAVSRARPPNRRAQYRDGEPRDCSALSSRPADHGIEFLLSGPFRDLAPPCARSPSPSFARATLKATMSSRRSPSHERSFVDTDAITG